MFARLFNRRDVHADTAFYTAIVARSRDEAFYRDLGVPDSIDGRFDMVALHVFLIMHRLKGEGGAAEATARRLYDIMTMDFDRTLREMGVGDSGLGRRVTAMVRGVAGRIQAYGAALAAADDRALEVVLDNNVYGTVHDVDPAALAAMAAYVRAQAAALAAQPLAEVLAGRPRFIPVPLPGGEPGGAHSG
ncbi:ubiquinol-cytochrome C chaperone family protein [Azospirillum halopraeferens]|uniref:ubiquinol-cytochrome C chaperone family protein n=1 Tax=Azospirillum halopraeferens TaxID=34010 RepID=UPI00041AE9F9|nr:ubiquinol-cytochrome C chaperone family protein [Azospirillum halopraeferens]